MNIRIKNDKIITSFCYGNIIIIMKHLNTNQFLIESNFILHFANIFSPVPIHPTRIRFIPIAVPTEMGILLKEHFNRWYSLKAYYVSVTLLDLPISVIKMEMKKKIGPQLLAVIFNGLFCFFPLSPPSNICISTFISFEFRIKNVGWQTAHRLRHFHCAHLYDNKSTI